MDRPAFAQALRSARKKAGLSQAVLAERSGLTAPYISLIESGRRRPPTPPLIERLAKALGIRPEPLAELAALERTPGTIRKRLEGLDRERGRAHKARDRILTTTLFNLARKPNVLGDLEPEGEEALWFRGVLGRLGSKLRSVPTAREARARSAELLDHLPTGDRDRLLEALPEMLTAASPSPEAGSTPTFATPPPAAAGPPASVRLEVRATLALEAATEEGHYVDGRWATPGAFLWRLASDEAYPRFEAGDLLLVEPGRAPIDGDLVALRREGRDSLRVLRQRGREVRLEALRPEVAPLRLSAADFAAVGVVTRVLRSLG